MSFDDDRERFQLRGNMAGFARWKSSNYWAGQADIARCRDNDLEAAAKFTAAAEAAKTKSFSTGPPVAIADRRPDPPAPKE
jgi:hypothetical protein